MRVTKLSSAFSEEIINTEEDLEKDGHIMCTTENNQRIFIEVNGDDPFYCDKRQHCPKSGLDEKSCSIFVNLILRSPYLLLWEHSVLESLYSLRSRSFCMVKEKRSSGKSVGNLIKKSER